MIVIVIMIILITPKTGGVARSLGDGRASCCRYRDTVLVVLTIDLLSFRQQRLRHAESASSTLVAVSRVYVYCVSHSSIAYPRVPTEDLRTHASRSRPVRALLPSTDAPTDGRTTRKHNGSGPSVGRAEEEK